MKKVIIIVVLLSIIGCEVEEKPMENHTCTEKQMRKAEKETKFCSENTGYLKSYCYNSAITRNCSKRKQSRK